MTLGEMMGLRWGWQGPSEVREPDQEPYFEIRIRELPEFFVAGRTPEEALAAAGSALLAFLQSYLDMGETPPLPADPQVSWIVPTTKFALPRSLPRATAAEPAIITALS